MRGDADAARADLSGTHDVCLADRAGRAGDVAPARRLLSLDAAPTAALRRPLHQSGAAARSRRTWTGLVAPPASFVVSAPPGRPPGERGAAVASAGGAQASGEHDARPRRLRFDGRARPATEPAGRRASGR